MKERPKHLPLGIVPKSTKVQSGNIFIKPEAVDRVLGFFFGKSVAKQNAVDKNNGKKNKDRQERDKQTLLKRCKPHVMYYKVVNGHGQGHNNYQPTTRSSAVGGFATTNN